MGCTSFAPALTALANTPSGSATVKTILTDPPPIVSGLKFLCSGDSSPTQNSAPSTDTRPTTLPPHPSSRTPSVPPTPLLQHSAADAFPPWSARSHLSDPSPPPTPPALVATRWPNSPTSPHARTTPPKFTGSATSCPKSATPSRAHPPPRRPHLQCPCPSRFSTPPQR